VTTICQHSLAPNPLGKSEKLRHLGLVEAKSTQQFTTSTYSGLNAYFAQAGGRNTNDIDLRWEEEFNNSKFY